MRKTEITMKSIRNNWSKIYRCGYCDLQHIFKYTEPQYYNAGVYGWNCDIYCDYGRDIAITTGYRNMAGKQIPSELIEKYSEIAKEIYKDTFKKSFEETKKALDQNIENFLNELEKI
jgi:hypothetical protein